MRKDSFLILSILLVCSCSSSPSQTNSGQVINLSDVVQTSTGVNNVVQNIQIVRLGETPAIIGEIDKIIVSDHSIYVLDRFRSKSLNTFTLDGEHKTTINYIGRGPGEFIGLDYFDVDVKTGEIVILDSNSRKLLFYDDEGKFLRELTFDVFANSFILTDENSIILNSSNNIFNNDDKYSLTLIDREHGEILDRFFQIDQNLENHNISPLSSLYRLSDTILYQPSLKPDLYFIDNGNIETRYHFELGRYWPSDSFLSSNKNNLNTMQYMASLADAGYLMFLNAIEGKQYISLNFIYQEKQYFTFIDKTTHSYKTFQTENEPISPPIASHNDRFISIKYHDDINPALLFFKLNESLD